MTLSAWTKCRVFGRSLFLQASWNPQGMQNLGLAYAVFPALRELYPEPDAQKAAVRRHLSFFNTHPYVAAAIVGGVLHHEEHIARGEESSERVVAFKDALMGPLAALGDGFFWRSLRPAVGAFCAATVPFFGAWAALLYLVLYNAVHFSLRGKLYVLGLEQGDKLIESLARAKLPTRGARLRWVAAISAGGLATWFAVSVGAEVADWARVGVLSACLGVCALAFIALVKRVSPSVVLYVSAFLAIAVGAMW
ncbi:MAG: PTS system mannose/fructose/sorbose family transporter subunit IID [Myxococcaceae bacterium]